MELTKILQADILDIIFEGRNKEYGAYELRKTYDKRLRNALLGTAAVVLLLFLGFLVSGMNGGSKKRAMIVDDIQLDKYKDQKKIEPQPLIPLPKPIVQQVKLTKFLIVKDKDVKPEDTPPDVDKIDDAKIGNVNVQGDKDQGITAPPVSDGKGVIEAPKDNTDYDQTFVSVQIESDYPGGIGAWFRYLSKNLHYPEEAISAEIQGDVIVSFIVDKEGNVSDVEAISGPNELRDEAVRVIRKSGKWTPAIQNGRQVKSYKKQPVKFRIDAGN